MIAVGLARCLRYGSLLALPFMAACYSYGQCSPQSGSPPSNLDFNTASNGLGDALPPAAADQHWTVAVDDINGAYTAAVVMDSLPPDYYRSAWSNCRWISISRTGQHSGDHHYFFKKEFDLPCTNACGKSYNSNNSFCLSLDVLADNSVYEIYVNGVPQSANLGHRIPVQPDPLHAVGMGLPGMLSFSLCNNWRAGANSLVIEVASSGPVTGFLAQASTVYPQSLSNFIDTSICKGSAYVFGSQTLTEPGITYQKFTTASGCDSTVALSLNIRPRASAVIDKAICEGQSFLGYTAAGTYVDSFATASGCDSLRILHLMVRKTPRPNLPLTATLCKGDSVVLYPGDYLSYRWQDLSTDKQLVVRAPGVYSVRVSDSCGEAEASVVATEATCGIYFSTAFTPNGDGLNDYFKVLSNERLEEYELFVYNRWGQRVFESHEQAKGWDGRLAGHLQPTEVFAWTCRYKRGGVAIHAKGTVTLIR